MSRPSSEVLPPRTNCHKRLVKGAAETQESNFAASSSRCELQRLLAQLRVCFPKCFQYRFMKQTRTQK